MITLAYLKRLDKYVGRVHFEYAASSLSIVALLGVCKFDGIVLSDSFMSSMNSDKEHEGVLRRLLFCIWQQRSKSYLFVLYNGGGFSYGSFGAVGALLARSNPYDFMWISMGNDLYGRMDRQEIQAKIAQDIIGRMGQVSGRQQLVFGGSSRIWGYDFAFGAEYDRAVSFVIEAVRLGGFEVVSGAGYLEGLELVDRIGHINWRDEKSVGIVELFLLGRIVHANRSRL